MSDALRLPSAIDSVATALLRDQPYHDVSYSNLQLYGDNIQDAVDRDCIVAPQSLSMVWPGGIPEVGNHFLTVLLDGEQPITHVQAIRQKIMSLKLSRRAIKRWDAFNQQISEQYGIQKLPAEIEPPFIEQMCIVKTAPLAVVSLAKVISHKKIKANEMIANLYFPTMMQSPVYALERLQEAQQGVINEERI